MHLPSPATGTDRRFRWEAARSFVNNPTPMHRRPSRRAVGPWRQQGSWEGARLLLHALLAVVLAAGATPIWTAEEKPASPAGPATIQAKPAADYKALPPWEGDGWKSLFDGKTLEGWKEVDFAGKGPVEVQGGKLVIGSGAMLTGVNLTRTNEIPRSDYELALDAMKVDGSDFFCALTFVVGDSCCSLIVGGWGGGVVGISSLDGNDASSNETTRFKDFDSKQWFRVRVRVTAKKLEAWIGTEKVVDVLLAGKRIGVRPGDIEMNQPFGLATYQTTSALRNIRWRPL